MKLLKTSIIPIAVVLILAYLGKYIYTVDDRVDWLRLCLVFGIPFGVPYMLFLIPIGGNPTCSITIMVINVLIGALFGCIIAVFALVRAVFFLFGWIINRRA